MSQIFSLRLRACMTEWVWPIIHLDEFCKLKQSVHVCEFTFIAALIAVMKYISSPFVFATLWWPFTLCHTVLLYDKRSKAMFYSRSPIIRNSINRKVRSTGLNWEKNHTWSSTVLSIFLCLFFPYNLFLFFHLLMDQRRKRVSLTIFQKVEILKKLQHGSSVKMIQEE